MGIKDTAYQVIELPSSSKLWTLRTREVFARKVNTLTCPEVICHDSSGTLEGLHLSLHFVGSCLQPCCKDIIGIMLF